MAAVMLLGSLQTKWSCLQLCKVCSGYKLRPQMGVRFDLMLLWHSMSSFDSVRLSVPAA